MSIYVFTGDGEGKTTASLGMALRSLGYGRKVVVVQFMKGRPTGESKFKHRGFELHQFGTGVFVMKPNKEDRALAKKALAFAKRSLKRADLLILDEANVTMKYGLIAKKDVLRFLKSVPEDKTVILTGRNAPREIVRIADMVSEVRNIKHPYQRGVPAKQGLQY